MNFIGRIEGLEIRVELKYCERCGGLWLRRQGNSGVYCAGCRACLAEVPTSADTDGEARRRKTSTRSVAGDKNIRSSGHIENLQGVAEMEVRA